MEKADLQAHKHAVVKQKNQFKQDLRTENARLVKANRQLEHDLVMIKSKITRLQAQHERQMQHVTTTSLWQIDKMARQLERRPRGGSHSDGKKDKIREKPYASCFDESLTAFGIPAAQAPPTSAC
jgi:hypothetical protein